MFPMVDVPRPSINCFPLFDICDNVNFRRIYNREEIKQTSYMTMMLNETEMSVLVTSRISEGNRSYTENHQKGHPYYKYEFEPLAVLVGITFIKEEVNKLKNKTSINCDSTRNAVEGKVSGGVYLHNDCKSELVNLIHFNQQDTFGFLLEYYIKDTLISCFDDFEDGTVEAKNIIQVYRKHMIALEQYSILANHVSNKYLINKAPGGELLLLKDYIQRLLFLFEYPFDTKCTRETNYTIRQIESGGDKYNNISGAYGYYH
jgi:hypothetical protein